jgi:hypothetical protein
MSADARKAAVGITVAIAVFAAVFLPGGLVLIPLAGLAFGAYYARRWAAGDPSRGRRVVASFVVAVGVFVLISIVWIIVVLSTSYDCEYDTVECSRQAEFLAAHFALGFLPLAALSLAAGWLVTSRRSVRAKKERQLA